MTHTANNELTTYPGALTPGELVDVTIRGARVVAKYLTSTVVNLTGTPGDEFDLPHGSGVSFARVAPAEWPPQPGDVWSDCDGATWVALGDLNGAVEMHLSKDITSRWSDPYEVLAVVSPMRLEYRNGWVPGEVDVEPAADPVEVDKRAERVAALRDLADLLDRNPGLSTPQRITIGAGGPAGLGEWAYVLGVEATSHPHRDSIQWWADKMIRGLEIHAYWIDDTGAGLDRDEPIAATRCSACGHDVGHADDCSAVAEFAALVAADEPTQLLPIVPLPGVGPQPVDDPIDPDPVDIDGEPRCTAATPDTASQNPDAQHYCELYGRHPGINHICVCGLEWPEPCDECETTGQNCRAHRTPAQRDPAE